MARCLRRRAARPFTRSPAGGVSEVCFTPDWRRMHRPASVFVLALGLIRLCGARSGDRTTRVRFCSTPVTRPLGISTSTSWIPTVRMSGR